MTRNEFKVLPLVNDAVGLKIGDRYIAYKVFKGESIKGYIQDSIKELAKRITAKKILEVGYGMGYVSEAIQKYFKPMLHIIVEARPDIAQTAREFAFGKSSVRIYEGFIQDFRSAEAFDLIYDDREELVDPSPIDWTKIRHKYWATFCHPPAGIEDMASGFIFESGGRRYFQHIHQPDEDYFT